MVGTGGELTPGPMTLHAGLAGTTSRFVTALSALGSGEYTIDGAPPLRGRPMAPLHDALAALGAAVAPGETAGHLPVTVAGPLRRADAVVDARRRVESVRHRADAHRARTSPAG